MVEIKELETEERIFIYGTITMSRIVTTSAVPVLMTLFAPITSPSYLNNLDVDI